MIKNFQEAHLSVIVPTYNHAHFLGAALNSIRSQTFYDWEVIVVNNFSEDDTIALVESYDDPRIRLVNFANNGVIGAARNYGLSLSQAPWVAFLDSDDLWYPKKLEYSLNKLDQGYDLVCHAELWVGPGEKKRILRYGPETRAEYDSLLFEGNCISTSAVVVKRKFLDQVGMFSDKAEFVTAEDYDLWLKLAKSGIDIGFIDDVLGEYRIHESNQSRQALRNSKAVRNVFDHHVKSLVNPEYHSKIRRREALIFYSGARALQGVGEHRQAWKHFMKAIFHYPWVLRFYVAMLLNMFFLRL